MFRMQYKKGWWYIYFNNFTARSRNLSELLITAIELVEILENV